MLYMPPARCEKCGKKFERIETLAEHEAKKPKCPKCGSKKVSFVPGTVYVVTRRAKTQESIIGARRAK